ncbi:MAG: N-acetylneuraminate synthase family protein [Actinomycetota bacterium]
MSDGTDQRAFVIGDRRVGPDDPPFVIAEIAQGHDGSLGTAHAYVDVAARCGADAVKFQTHIAEAESTPAEPWRVKFSPQDETRFEYWQRMEFSAEQWAGLAGHCAEAGIAFLSSAFSLEAVDLLASLDMAAWKLASGEVTNVEMIDHMLATGRPLLTSSGMSPVAEIDAIVERARAADTPVGVFQCTSSYPCPPETIGLNVVSDFVDRWGVPVGLSDHSGTIYPALAATTLGASMIEVHLTFSREMFGPDVPSSLTPDELTSLVDGSRFIHASMRSPVDKDEVAERMEPMRKLFTKSLVTSRALSAGAVLEPGDLLARKPGSGIPAARLADVVGSRLTRDVEAWTVLQETDVE